MGRLAVRRASCCTAGGPTRRGRRREEFVLFWDKALALTPNNAPVAHIFSNKDLVVLIMPLIVEQFLVFSLGLADIIMVAALGEEAVSAASIGDSINVLINGLFMAMATGGAVVCAHYFGSKNVEMISRTAKQLIYSTVGISIVITVLGLLLEKQLLSLIFGNIEPLVMRDTEIYFFYSLMSYPFIALYSAAAALFRTQGNSRVSMLASLLVNILNIGGNAVCIYFLKMGIEGVAIPSLIARAIAAAALTGLLYRRQPYRGNPGIDIRHILKIKLDFNVIRKILSIGVPNGVENSVFQIGKILVLTLIAELGTSAVAANAAAMTLVTFNVLPGTAMGYALITVVGRALGTGNKAEARYFNRKLMLISYLAIIAINIPLLLAARPLVGVFGLKTETTSLALFMYIFYGICAIIIWAPSFALPNTLRAANDAKFTMIVSFASMWIVRVGLSYLFVRLTNWGAISVWYAMIIDWVVRAIIFVHRTRKHGLL